METREAQRGQSGNLAQRNKNPTNIPLKISRDALGRGNQKPWLWESYTCTRRIMAQLCMAGPQGTCMDVLIDEWERERRCRVERWMKMGMEEERGRGR